MHVDNHAPIMTTANLPDYMHVFRKEIAIKKSSFQKSKPPEFKPPKFRPPKIQATKNSSHQKMHYFSPVSILFFFAKCISEKFWKKLLEMSCVEHTRCPAWNTGNVLLGTQDMSCLQHRKSRVWSIGDVLYGGRQNPG